MITRTPPRAFSRVRLLNPGGREIHLGKRKRRDY